MESLAYLYSALSYEESAPTEPRKSDRQPNLFEGFNWKKFSSRALLFLLPLLVGFSVFASPQEAQARNLKYGTKGSDVVLLQKILKAKGAFHAKATGYFGKHTKKAVLKFQKKNGLKADGIVGPQTLKKL